MFVFLTALATLVIAIVALCQVRTATRAAKAAEVAANEAKATRFADNRPALAITRCERSVTNPMIPGRMVLVTWIGLRITNCGKGPASVRNSGFRLGDIEYGREGDEPLPPQDHYYLPPAPTHFVEIPDIRFHEFARKCLGASAGGNHFHQLFLQKAAQPQDGTGPKRLDIEGWIEYDDIFEKRHGQKFKFRQIDGNPPTYEVIPGAYYQPRHCPEQTETTVSQEPQDERECKKVD
ncbi:MAG: hypothetical protein WBD63_05730 [Phycisphaerae bacterium]|nr:hypothetical protein [Phycisphaerae bacterium]